MAVANDEPIDKVTTGMSDIAIGTTADASLGSTVSAGSAGVIGFSLSESEAEGELDFAAEQNRRERSPSSDFVISKKERDTYIAKANILDKIAATMMDWAADARAVAAGDRSKIVETPFPPDLVESFLHQASALRGKHAHSQAQQGRDGDYIKTSVERQAANVMLEVGEMAKQARKDRRARARSPSILEPKRDRSASRGRSSGVSKRVLDLRPRSPPPRAAPSTPKEKYRVPRETTSKHPPAKQPLSQRMVEAAASAKRAAANEAKRIADKRVSASFKDEKESSRKRKHKSEKEAKGHKESEQMKEHKRAKRSRRSSPSPSSPPSETCRRRRSPH